MFAALGLAPSTTLPVRPHRRFASWWAPAMRRSSSLVKHRTVRVPA